ncbi:hypothetical protein ANCCEY_03288 [Ancylostoma ceylanicum]|uniref:G-protein coupled receptors family 1 profile domain-containing protein n=1 Tax=Ancylostoma ceylanicum TaxID=53326 RepID=A0A0D6M5C8_9BILA|nr:hypothetical protein ANCCEY_03288 [Ancylostoma ceylanicum]
MTYLPSLLQLVIFGSANDTEESVKEVLQRSYPQYMNYTGTISGIKDVIKFNAMFGILHITVPVAPVYITILVLRAKIVQQLQSQENMSHHTRLMHKQLLKAITYQACLPMLILIPVVAYAIGQLDIYHHPALEYCVRRGRETGRILAQIC